MSDPILDAMAEQAHESWAGWTKWMLEKIDQTHPSGETYRERWVRQIQTPYAELSEAEKESDRIEARKWLDVYRFAKADTEAWQNIQEVFGGR